MSRESIQPKSWLKQSLLVVGALLVSALLQADEPAAQLNRSSSSYHQATYAGPVPTEEELLAYEEETEQTAPIYQEPHIKRSGPVHPVQNVEVQGEWQEPLVRGTRRAPAKQAESYSNHRHQYRLPQGNQIQQVGYKESTPYEQDQFYIARQKNRLAHKQTAATQSTPPSPQAAPHHHAPQSHQHEMPQPLTAPQKPYYPRRHRVQQVQHETVDEELQPLTRNRLGHEIGHIDAYGGKLVSSSIVDSYIVGDQHPTHAMPHQHYSQEHYPQYEHWNGYPTHDSVCGTSTDSCSVCGDDGWCAGRRFQGKHVGSRLASDYAFGDFIEPITNPYWFIDPRAMTRIRLVTINQDIPETDFSNSGETSITTFQGSIALNERLSFMAVKGGRQKIEIEGQNDLDGWLDLALGAKWVFKRNVEKRTLLSGGVIYERTQGSSDVFQGNGHGMWNIYLSHAKGWRRTHWISTLGWHLPNNHDQENESLYYSTHLDYAVTCNKFLVWELNGIHYTESGNFTPGTNLEGGDLFSLGADNVTGNDVVTTAVGGVWRVRNSFDIAAAYEVPITGRRDLLQDRWTVNFSYTY